MANVTIKVQSRKDFNKVLRALKKKKLENSKLKRLQIVLACKRAKIKNKKRK